MRTSARILISLAVVIVVLGALNLWTEWGQKDFSVDADAVGAWAFLAVSCLVVGVVLNALSKAGEPPAEAADETPGDDEADGPGTPLCPSCLAPTERLQDFCDECGSPVSSHAEIEPVGQMRSIGCMVSKAATGPPRRIVMIGMWCIFALSLGLCIWGIVLVLNQQADLSMQGETGSVELVEWNEWIHRPEPAPAPWTLTRILGLSMLIGFLALYAAILTKTTRNYFRKKQTLDIDSADAKTVENIEVDV